LEKDRRTSGILIPAFSARREGDFGVGDTLALRHWIDWCADHHVGFIQLLPIHESGPDESPYSAISSIALDPIYLTISPEEVPGLEESTIIDNQEKLDELSDSDTVRHQSIRRLKRVLLEAGWRRRHEWPSSLSAEFIEFQKAEKRWLEDYALFRWLMEIHGESLSWNFWPTGCQSPEGARRFLAAERSKGPDADDRLGYFAFVQWLCFRQWRALRRHADERGVKLMGDIPIGVSWHSTDTFFDRNQFHLDLCGGSPPEPMVPDDKFFQQWGQNWGIPLYRWDRMEKDGFSWWKARVNRMTEIFRIFRIDHILGFYRIYSFPWPPSRNHEFIDASIEQAAELTGGRLPRWSRRPDDSPENEEANRLDGDLRLRSILSEVGEAEVIAEDLGWVPGYVRPHLTSLGVAGFRIPHWESDHGHAVTGDRFPECSFATYSTHDHDPVNTIWRWCHEAIQRNLYEPSHDHQRDADHASHTLRLMSEFSGIPIPANGVFPPFTDGVHWRLIKALFASKSRYAVLSVTELFGIEARINRPGSHGGQNWTFRLPWTIEEIRQDPKLAEIGRRLTSIIGVTRRA
jgi:4-alpha-glucanotransferase